MTVSCFTVLGGGAWGTALAMALRSAGHEVRLWARDVETVESIRIDGENPRYLPGIAIDPAINPTTDAREALDGAHHILLAVPAQTLRDVLNKMRSLIPDTATLILCAKGIERSTGRLLSSIVEEILPGHPVAALSGPSFASDVARGLPTAVVIASPDGERAFKLASLVSSRSFRCYSTDDLAGVEVGGALKNVLAIAAGTVAGAELGASAQAAMVTRGFVELRRFAAAFGARPETMMGLSGLGDLILTCGSAQSRNFAYGMAVGRGNSLDSLPLAEGVATASIAARLAAEKGIAAPIITAVDSLLGGTTTIAEAVANLMARPLRAEDE